MSFFRRCEGGVAMLAAVLWSTTLGAAPKPATPRSSRNTHQQAVRQRVEAYLAAFRSESATSATAKRGARNATACPTNPLAAGTPVSDNLSDQDCRVRDFYNQFPVDGYARLYKLTIADTAGLGTLTLSSTAFSPVVIVYDAKNNLIDLLTGDRVNPAIFKYSLAPGDYSVIVSALSVATGAFTLTATVDPLLTCNLNSVNFGDTLNGELNGNSCRILDFEVPSDDQRPADVYKLVVSEYSLASIDVGSNVFDTDLILLDENKTLIDENDDADNTTLNSNLTLSLPAGTYFALATASTYSDIFKGAYAMRVLGDKARVCASQNLDTPGLVQSTLTQDDCRLLDYYQFDSDFIPVKLFRIQPGKRGMLTVEVSARYSALGALFSADRKTLFDYAQGSPGRLILQVRPAPYDVIVASLSANQFGDFTVRTTLDDVPSCALDTLTLGTAANGTLDSTACPLRNVIFEYSATNAARQYTLTVDQPGSLAVNVTAAVFPPGVILLDSDDRILKVVTLRTSGTASVTAAVKPGNYRVVVLTNSSTAGGPYGVTATLQ